VPDNLNGASILAPNSTDFTIGPMTLIGLEFPFSANTQTNASFGYIMPSQWTGGTLTFSAIWYGIGGSGNVNWNLTAYCAKDGDALNARWSMAPATIVDASQGLNKVHVSGISGNLIPAGSPAASSMCWFQVGRDYASTFTGPAELLGVRVYYPTV
jgi:hypothetical protein